MANRMAVLLAVGTVTVGCAQAHAPDDVASGIYELTIESATEACSPVRAIGTMGSVAVLVEDGAIDAPVPDIEAPLLVAPRVRLTPGLYHSETNRRLPGCDGAWVHEEWTVIDATATGFDLMHTQEWQGMSSCVDPRVAMPSAPDADCMSERILRYGLSTECRAPCALQLTAGGAVECSCS
jgi:hypothetical protein